MGPIEAPLPALPATTLADPAEPSMVQRAMFVDQLIADHPEVSRPVPAADLDVTRFLCVTILAFIPRTLRGSR
jgi:hypothetical protein